MSSQRLRCQCAFSLLETLAATAITAGIAAVAFHLFHHNERLFRDQALILEMQQSARVVVSQLTDDVRRVGQAIPTSLGDIILPGCDVSRLNVRASFNSVETLAVTSLPLALTIGVQSSITLESTMGLVSGRQAFLWTDRAWVRATIDSVSGAASSVRLTPTAASQTPLQFVLPPAVSLDEAVSTFWDASTKTVRRTTASNTTDPASPVWGPAHELATNVMGLSFFYYDSAGRAVIPDTAANRSQILSIDVRVVVRVSAVLSNGSRPTYALSSRAVARNLALR
jgi:Tfp pilus assembly protein PilW